MASRKVKLGEDMEFSLTPKVLAGIIGIVSAVIGYHYWILGQLDEAKSLPKIGNGVYIVDPADPAAKETYPPSRQEFQMKDELTRQEIMQLKELINNK
jgi:hypothetical protein